MSLIDLLSGNLTLSSLYWGGLHRGKRSSDSEDFEEVDLHIGRYNIIIVGRIKKKA